MARIFKIGKVWYTDITINGKRFRQRAGTSKELTRLKLNDLEIKAQRGDLGFLELQQIPVKTFIFEKYLPYCETHHRQSTVKRYKGVFQNFLQFLETHHSHVTKLRQIDAELLEAYKTFRRTTPVTKNGSPIKTASDKIIRKGARSMTVNFELDSLRTVFNLAIRWKFLETNPMQGVKLLKTDDKSERRFLSPDQCGELLKACKPDFYPVIFTLLQTGMRVGELEHLEWSDIDFDRKQIHIRAKKDWLPKTGEREIPISPDLHAVLEYLPKKQERVFITEKGKVWDDKRIRRALIATADEAGLHGFTKIHDLRHTFVSLLNRVGVDLPTIQQLAGHKDIATTLGYTHVQEKHLHESIAKLPVKLPQDAEVVRLPAAQA